jgi:hypothetical protein
MKFSQKNLRIGDFEKLSFFESAILDFYFSKKKLFLLHPHENLSKFLGYQGWFEILMITLVSSKKSLPPNISGRLRRFFGGF